MTVMPYASDSPAAKILAYLQRHGEGTVRELEDLLGISTTAVREHLTHLEARDLVGARQVRQGPGRPKLMYSLLPRARELFPNKYGMLVTMLMRELAKHNDPELLRSLLDSVGKRLVAEYGVELTGATVGERLQSLRTILEERGIPVDIDPTSAGFQIFSCPYYDVAQEHPEICAMERGMWEQVLGETIRLEGAIREGRRSCHFIVDQDQQ